MDSAPAWGRFAKSGIAPGSVNAGSKPRKAIPLEHVSSRYAAYFALENLISITLTISSVPGAATCIVITRLFFP